MGSYKIACEEQNMPSFYGKIVACSQLNLDFNNLMINS